MNEIIIDEKKYISSKQAAKITGYAKDYVGQLCREGRVPSRLVGRSWYVLETAIKDHRFGSEKAADEKKPSEKLSGESEDVQKEFPHYEAGTVATLPSLNILNKPLDLSGRITEVSKESTEKVEGSEKLYSTEDSGTPNALHNSWNEWFSRPTSDEAELSVVVEEEDLSETVIVSPDAETAESVTEDLDEEVSVPLHTFSGPLPHKDLLPAQNVPIRRREAPLRANEDTEPVVQRERVAPASRGRFRILFHSLRVVLVLIALSSVLFTALGSGYLDQYVMSANQAKYLPGITVYNR